MGLRGGFLPMNKHCEDDMSVVGISNSGPARPQTTSMLLRIRSRLWWYRMAPPIEGWFPSSRIREASLICRANAVCLLAWGCVRTTKVVARGVEGELRYKVRGDFPAGPSA